MLTLCPGRLAARRAAGRMYFSPEGKVPKARARGQSPLAYPSICLFIYATICSLPGPRGAMGRPKSCSRVFVLSGSLTSPLALRSSSTNCHRTKCRRTAPGTNEAPATDAARYVGGQTNKKFRVLRGLCPLSRLLLVLFLAKQEKYIVPRPAGRQKEEVQQ